MSNQRTPSQLSLRGRTRGFSLIELMIAMVLGLIVIAGAGSVFLASRRTYQTNQGLSDVQQNARIAFELLARDIRQAGLNGCNNNGRIANVLNNGPNGADYDPNADWFTNWNNAVRGYAGGQDDPAIASGTAVTERVKSTDSLQLLGIEGAGLSVESSPSDPAANFKLNQPSTELQVGDIAMVCDPDHAAIFQISNIKNSNVTLVHNSGKGTPGNCAKGLGYPTKCPATTTTNANGNTYSFGANSTIAKFSAVDWYIGNNPVNGRSLYRVKLVNNSGIPTPTAQEMVRNVTEMQILYHLVGQNKLVDATTVGSNWGSVDAVRVTLTLESADKRAGLKYKPLKRTFTATTTLRNRVK